jgi:hypothetical protein
MDVPNVIARVLRERLDVRVEGVDERRDGSTSPRRALGEVRRPESRCRGWSVVLMMGWRGGRTEGRCQAGALARSLIWQQTTWNVAMMM